MNCEKEFEEQLYRATEATFEKMAFMEVMPSDTDLGCVTQSDFRSSRILFDAHIRGAVTMFLPLELLSEVFETLYNIPSEEQDSDMIRDLLGEITNTVVGNFLTLVVPDDVSYKMGIPQFDTSIDTAGELELMSYSYKIDDKIIKIELMQRN